MKLPLGTCRPLEKVYGFRTSLASAADSQIVTCLQQKSVTMALTCVEGIAPLSLLDEAVHLVHGVDGLLGAIPMG